MSTIKTTGKHFLRKMGEMNDPSEVQARHLSLSVKYKEAPELAMITDMAEVIGVKLDDPFRTRVVLNSELKSPLIVGVHRAVGGEHDYPNPGDMLCASLASCMETTTRMIANRYKIKLKKTRVKVEAKIDVRGALRLTYDTLVAFQSMHIDYHIQVDEFSKKELKTFLSAVKKSCIVYQTLKQGVPISINCKV